MAEKKKKNLLWDSYNPSPNIGGLQAQWWFLLRCSELVWSKHSCLSWKPPWKPRWSDPTCTSNGLLKAYDQLDFHWSTLPKFLEMMMRNFWYKDLALREDSRLLFVRHVLRIAFAEVPSSLITSRSPFIAQVRDSPYCLLHSFMWSGLIAVLWLCGQWLILLSGRKGLESPGSGYLICVFCGSLRRDNEVMAASAGHWSQRVIAALAKPQPQPQHTFLKGSYRMFFSWFDFLHIVMGWNFTFI